MVFNVKGSFAILLIFVLLTLASLANAADSGVLTVSATVLSKGQCRFNSSTSALNFGSLDPANPIDKIATTTIIFRCQANGNALITFFVTDNDGLYKTGPDTPRMRHTTQTSEYLPYTLTYNPSSGSVPKVTDQNLTVSGTVRGNDYQDAYAGNYSDTVTLSINP